jgi:hypothetical protein
VIDPRTVYFRPPAGLMESDTLLLMMRNLMKSAYERELRGEKPPELKAAGRPVVGAGRR